MELYKVNTPEGTRDRLFAECTRRRRVQNALTRLFEKRGYNEVITPELEYYDLFVKAENPIAPENMMKMTDRDGRLVVLRPDCTAPIARIAATKLRDAVFPQRLYYNQTIYRVSGSASGHDNEIAQCGIELLGAGGLRGDIEAVAIAVDALCAAGADNFHIELGHAGFFEALADSLDLTALQREKIKSLLELKNFAALEDYLEKLGDRAAVIRELPYLFGGPEILKESKKLLANDDAQHAIDSLEAIYAELQEAGRGSFLRFDLGFTQSINYYSGLIFRGYVEGAGSTVLAGGRYDGLVGDFGFPLPATGFAVYIDELSRCLEVTPSPHLETVLIHYSSGNLRSALDLLDTQAPGTASLSPFAAEDETHALAAQTGAKVIVAGLCREAE